MSHRNRNCWIFGGTGFIGSALVQKLSCNRQNKIHLLVHRNISSPETEPFLTVRGDLSALDFNWFERFPPDIIYHTAQITGSTPLVRKIASMRGRKANQRLTNYLIKQDKPPKTVYVSGSLMYGNQSDGLFATESSQMNPYAYAGDYYRAEEPWLDFQRHSNGLVYIARPGWVIGPDSWFRRFFWEHFLNTNRVPVYGNGEQLMSLIHVDDLATALVRLGTEGYPMTNLFAAEPISQLIFCQNIADQLRCGIETISFSETAKTYGRVVAEALTSSIPLSTEHKDLLDQLGFAFKSPDMMIERTLSVLESE